MEGERKKEKGIKIDGIYLNNSRFADDVIEILPEAFLNTRAY